uniref:Apple domain-containing protein n=1 Tax=Spongospora subterranea TaxID=70186 RepID=A0A0H5QHL0_9EUKA|eukprot:CRZ00796.1 hypothetical protein [Spongospora subterranea]
MVYIIACHQISYTMLLLIFILLMAIDVHGQTPNGYALVSDNDYIIAGSEGVVIAGIATVKECAERCNADKQCQSFLFTTGLNTMCTVYSLRRCQTPAVHDPQLTAASGILFEKTASLVNPDNFIVFNMNCGIETSIEFGKPNKFPTTVICCSDSKL